MAYRHGLPFTPQKRDNANGMVSCWRVLSPLVLLFPICLGLIGEPPAQEQSKVAEPEYVNEFFLLDATGALKPFERATPRAEAKPRALGLGGATVSYLISGGRSPVRIAERAGLFAIVRLPSREIDPATVVQLYRLKVKNDRRELQILKANAYLGTKATQEDSAVPFEVSSYGEKSFRIKPKIDLRPGEYAFSLTTSRDGYCFGIDSALAPNR